MAVGVRTAGEQPEVRPRKLLAPQHDEVRVRLEACGVCHTDVAWADGGLFDRFPVVLGHESAGVVEEVGPGVTRVRPGIGWPSH